MNTKFKHVSYLWDDEKAKSFGDDEVALFIYRSNLLGADLRLTNYGGGNTSVKVNALDPITQLNTEVMWIKGSGGDIGTLTKSGCAALYLQRLRDLEKIYKGKAYEDGMVRLFDHCIFDLDSKAPSIDTPLHGFLPFKHIDHLHPDAAIAIAAAKDGEYITKTLFKGEIGWVPWQRPGFDLGLQLRTCLEDALAEGRILKGIMLGSHGLFTWGETSYESYINTLEVVDICAQYIEFEIERKGKVFGGIKSDGIVDQTARRQKASAIAPLLRGLSSTNQSMVGHFSDTDAVMQFVNSHDLVRLAEMGTSCPDHFLRTKIAPLVLDISTDADLADTVLIDKLNEQYSVYRAKYEAYYDACKHPNSPAMRDPNPVVILYPGVGMFTFAKDKTTARLASEYYINAINVMRGSEAISEYTSLPHQEAFDIEYWLLEEAKLQRMPKPKVLTGKVALVTGSGGGIGKAISKKFLDEGACVVINDINEERIHATVEEFSKAYGKDRVRGVVLDVTNQTNVIAALENTAIEYGGVDIVVSNAGISISKSIKDHTLEEWDKLYDILVKGQFIVSQAAIAIMRKQGRGGDLINIVSKNAVVAGPNNPGYGSAKAAQSHLSRLIAAEVGSDKIRVNVVNPDAVISDSNIWSGGWAEGRAKAYGINIEDLPAFYAKRTLLNEVILPEDIANACFVYVSGMLNKSTGNVLNVDGGVPMGFYR
jgi:rhamnulose-1-phosphate aldolase/alcohol dehydrogenase